MWFAFGFITLGCYFAYLFSKRTRARWKGLPMVTQGIAHERANRPRGRLLRLGLPAPAGIDLVLLPETFLARLFKGIGLSEEFQVGRDRFDAAVYIGSDDAELCRRLALKRELQADILAIFDAEYPEGCALREIRCLSGRLWADFSVHPEFPQDSVSAVERVTMAPLKRIADALTAMVAGSNAGTKPRDPFVRKAMVVLALSSTLAFVGFTQWFRHIYQVTPLILDGARLAWFTALAGVVILLLLIALTIKVVGRSARAHLVLLEVLLVGGSGSFFAAWVGLQTLNSGLDHASATPITVQVSGKEPVRGRRHTDYYVIVPDWAKPGTDLRLNVPYWFFHNTPLNDTLVVNQHPGALGLRWVSSFRGAHGGELFYIKPNSD